MTRLAVFLINLDGSDARLQAATAGLQAAGIAFTRLPAFDGRKMAMQDLPLYDPEGSIRDHGRELVGGEVGCFLSHLEAARRFLALDVPYGLVLEDDLTVPSDAGAALDRLLDALDTGAALTPWGVANLGQASHRIATPLCDVGGGRVLERTHYFPVTTTAILWTRAGAEAFLAASSKITMPVDHWLRRLATASDSGIALNPPLFPSAQTASEIDAATHRSGVSRGLAYFRARQFRLWTNKYRAWRHKTAFPRVAR